MTRKIGDDEQQIANLLFKRRRSLGAGSGEFRGDFLGFLANLAKNVLRVVPVEADRGRLLLQLEGAGQRGQGERHAVKQTGRRRALLRRLLARFDCAPLRGHAVGVERLGVAENVRMPANELVADRVDDVLEGESVLLLRHSGMEHDLQEEIA